MEDALAPVVSWMAINAALVLILVVMEDALAHTKKMKNLVIVES